jgi:hypothetical protein
MCGGGALRRGFAAIALTMAIGCSRAAPAIGQEVQVPLLKHFEEKSQMLPDEPYRVLRIDLDITGDGVAELLLAKTLPNGGSGEQEWFVYSKIEDTRYRLLAVMDFSFRLFRMSEKSKLVLYDRGLGVLVAYRVDGAGFHEESRRSDVAAGGQEWEAFDSWRRAARLKVLSVEVKDLETNADPKWTDLLNNEVISGVGNLAGLVVVH